MMSLIQTLPRRWPILRQTGKNQTRSFDRAHLVSRGVNLLCLCSCIVMAVICAVCFHLTGNTVFLSDGLLGILLSLVVIGLNSLRLYDAAKAIFYLVMNLFTMRIGSYLGHSEDTELSYFFLFALIFVVFDHLYTRLFCIAVILVRVMLYRLDHRYLSGIPALLPEAHQAVIHWMADAGILALILTVFYLSISWKIREDKLNEKKVLFVEEMVHDMRAAFFAHGGICAALKYATDENLPLSNIKALIDKLEETKEFFNYVLNEMLNYSTLEKGIFDHVKYEDMDLTYEITKVVSAHNYQAIQNGITIHLKLAPGLPAVIQSDRVKVVRVLINLLSNAIKFTEPGKSIVVSADVYGPQWQLSVFNEGKQLTEEDMAGLFLLKRQMTDGRGQGRNGLGLPITKELVKRLGGTIHVNSAIDGTAFTVALPLS